MPPPYYRGRVEPPNLAFLKAQSLARHWRKLSQLPRADDPSFDTRDHGWCSGIKDQSQCGSCWDFSGTAVVEGAFWKAGHQIVLSEEYTLSCGNNGGCNGDDNTTVLIWAKETGLPLSSDYGPYTASADRCAYAPSMPLYKLDDWGFCDGSGQGVTATPKIKACMKQYGVIGCAVDAGFDDPGTGVISGDGSNIDHDVALIGWDDSKGKAGAWLMKNSWGTGWGNKGFAWIEYGAFSIGTEAVWGLVNGAPPPPPILPIPWIFL